MRLIHGALALLLLLPFGCAPSTARQAQPGTPDLAMPLPPPAPPDMAPLTYNDFPPAPVIDPNGSTPPGAPGLFGGPSSGTPTGGPCLLDPEPGSLFPQNWLRPRFHFTPMSGQNLFELRLHAANEANDLVVYTTQTTWTMDKATWSGLSAHVVDQPITVTVRGAAFDGTKLTAGPALGSSGDITIAPVAAPGAIIYWTETTAKVTALRGFTFGEETVHDVITPAQVSSSSQCVACHVSTPDGMFVGLAWTSVIDNGDPAQIAMLSTDGQLTKPSFVSAAAATLLARTGQELPSFSQAHWKPGDRTMLSMLYNGSTYDIAWTDLEATATSSGTGTLARTNDPGSPGAAAFSHDGASVVYASSSSVASGYQMTDGDLRIIPFNNRQGGVSAAVPGASDPSFNEYFPTYSPDDQWIAFSRLPKGANNYTPTNTPAEVLVVPAAGPPGTTATRLAANDPPACSGLTSPGVTNSWPKWAPDVATVGSRRFYWLTFSSKRIDPMVPQLFVTPIVVDGGTVKTYPALYLWNQPADQGNHTPAWDNFLIPIS